MKFFIALAFTGLLYADACTAVTGGSIIAPFSWSTAANWTGCSTGGAHAPRSGDTVTIPSGANIVVNVNTTVGASGQPFYYYPYITGNGGSGYTNSGGSCGGGLTGTTVPERAAGLFCSVVNGALSITLWDHGYYTTSAVPTLTALSAPANPTYLAGLSANTNPVRFGLRNANGGALNVATGWLPGSTQVLNVSGFTGSWAPLNTTLTVTVISDDIIKGTVVSAPFNGTSWGAVTGTPVITSPSVTYGAGPGSPTWSLATMAGGGTPAVLINHTGASSGTLTVASGIIFTHRGDIVVSGTYPDTTTAIVLKRGAHLIADNSLYVGSPKPEYGVLHSLASSSESLLFDASDCINATRAGTDKAAHIGECWIVEPGGISGMTLNIQNVFMNAGAADEPAVAIGGNGQSTLGMVVYNSWFDGAGTLSNLGEYHLGSNAGSGVVDVQGNIFSRPANAMPVRLTSTFATGTGGPRTFSYNYVDGPFNFPIPVSSQFSGAIANNFIANSLYLTAVGISSTLNNNIIRVDPTSPGPGVQSYSAVAISLAGGADHNALWQDVEKATNQRWVGCGSYPGLVYGWTFHTTGATIGDPGEVGCALSYSLLLPTGTGFSGSRMESMASNPGPTNGEKYYHNTATPPRRDAIINTNETGNAVQHPLILQDTIGWLPAWANDPVVPGDKTWFKVATSATPGGLDVCTTTSVSVSNCDYNSGFGAAALQTTVDSNQCGSDGSLCANQGPSYGGSWSFPPGSHDVDDNDPNFVDGDRNLLWYDQGRGVALAAVWDNTVTYAWGDRVSNNYSDDSVPFVYYGGRLFNFVCKVATCPAGFEPGRVDVTTWRQFWMFGGQWQILQDTWAYGKTAPITDSSFWGNFTLGTGPFAPCSSGSPCSATQAAMGWIAAGLRPQNQSLIAAGHDGTDIGALPVVPAAVSAGLHPDSYIYAAYGPQKLLVGGSHIFHLQPLWAFDMTCDVASQSCTSADYTPDGSEVLIVDPKGTPPGGVQNQVWQLLYPRYKATNIGINGNAAGHWTLTHQVGAATNVTITADGTVKIYILSGNYRNKHPFYLQAASPSGWPANTKMDYWSSSVFSSCYGNHDIPTSTYWNWGASYRCVEVAIPPNATPGPFTAGWTFCQDAIGTNCNTVSWTFDLVAVPTYAKVAPASIPVMPAQYTNPTASCTDDAFNPTGGNCSFGNLASAGNTDSQRGAGYWCNDRANPDHFMELATPPVFMTFGSGGEGFGKWYYDGAKVFYNIGEWFGDPTWKNCARMVAARYAQFGPGVPGVDGTYPPGQIYSGPYNNQGTNTAYSGAQNWRKFPDGVRIGLSDFNHGVYTLNSADPGSWNAEMNAALNGMWASDFASPSNTGVSATYGYEREVSYALDIATLLREHQGLALRDASGNLTPFGAAYFRIATSLISIVLEYFSPPASGTYDVGPVDYQSWSGGLVLEALRRYYEQTSDPRALYAYKLQLDDIYANYSFSAHAMKYMKFPDGPFCYGEAVRNSDPVYGWYLVGLGGTPNSNCAKWVHPNLNGMLASNAAWWWRNFGGSDTTYQVWADDLFTYSLVRGFGSPKEMDQNFRFVFDYLRWRQGR